MRDDDDDDDDDSSPLIESDGQVRIMLKRIMHDIIFNYRADFAETGGLAWVD